MPRFIFKISLFVLLVAAVLGITGLRHRPNYFEELREKYGRLKVEAAPRLIFVGGSNLALGMDSATVAEAIDCAPVNMGLHAQQGLDLMLSEVQDWLRAGDVVVVCPEYELFTPQMRWGRPQELVASVEACPEVLGHMAFQNQKRFVDNWHRTLFRNFQRQMGAYRAALRRRTSWSERLAVLWSLRLEPFAPAIPMKAYSFESFNAVGDAVFHLDKPRPKPIEYGIGVPTDPVQLSGAIERLNQFADKCRSKGAVIFLSHPPVPEQDMAASRKDAIRFDIALREQLRISLLDSALEMAYPDDCFYDTVYHLSGKGRTRRTEWMIDKLQTALHAERLSK